MKPDGGSTSLMASFGHAFAGVFEMCKSGRNARIHLITTVVVVGAGLFFALSRAEWCVIVLVVAVVWCAEAFNTALELLADAVKPGYDPLVGKAKDVAAGAVLITALGAIVIGLLVFGPYILKTLG